MNNIRFYKSMIIAAAFLILFGSVRIMAAQNTNTSDDQEMDKTPPKPARQAIVFYFHGAKRCSGCIATEAKVRKILEKEFPNAISEGRLELRSVNIQEQENEHYWYDFNLRQNSFVIVEMDNDKIVRWKLLRNVWGLQPSTAKLTEYIRTEVAKFMENMDD